MTRTLQPECDFDFDSAFSYEGREVSLAKNPSDLRPAVDVIIKAIRNYKGDRPLAVLMSEHHNRPAHILLRQMVMQRLLTGGSSFAYGTEFAKNQIQLLCENSRDPVVRGLSPALKNNPDGQTFLDTKLLLQASFHAPVSNKNILAFCRKHNVSISPNDAVKQSGKVVDESDKLNAQIIAEVREDRELADDILDQFDGINCSSAYGLAIRNAVMATNAAEHHQQTGADLYLQSCGGGHLFGSKSRKAEYRHSLSAHFARVGFVVLPVFLEMSNSRREEIPEEGRRALSRGIILRDVDEHAYHRDEKHFSALREKCRIANLKWHSGNEIEVVTIPDRNDLLRSLQQRLAPE